jgi:hypothetical protein
MVWWRQTATTTWHIGRDAGVDSDRVKLGHGSGLGDRLRSWAGWRCLGTGPAMRNGSKAGVGHT